MKARPSYDMPIVVLLMINQISWALMKGDLHEQRAQETSCILAVFWVVFGSGGVPWGRGWIMNPWGLRMGWAVAEKLVCEGILGCMTVS